MGHRVCLGDLGDWGKSGGKGGIWVQRVKKTFSPPLSVSLSLSLPSSFSVCLFLSPSLVKVGEVAGKERGPSGYQPLEQASVSIRQRAPVQDSGQAVLG